MSFKHFNKQLLEVTLFEIFNFKFVSFCFIYRQSLYWHTIIFFCPSTSLFRRVNNCLQLEIPRK